MKLREESYIFELLSYKFEEIKGLEEVEKEVVKRFKDADKEFVNFNIYIDVIDEPKFVILENESVFDDNMILIDEIDEYIEEAKEYDDTDAYLLLVSSYKSFRITKLDDLISEVEHIYNSLDGYCA